MLHELIRAVELVGVIGMVLAMFVASEVQRRDSIRNQERVKVLKVLEEGAISKT